MGCGGDDEAEAGDDVTSDEKDSSAEQVGVSMTHGFSDLFTSSDEKTHVPAIMNPSEFPVV